MSRQDEEYTPSIHSLVCRKRREDWVAGSTLSPGPRRWRPGRGPLRRLWPTGSCPGTAPRRQPAGCRTSDASLALASHHTQDTVTHKPGSVHEKHGPIVLSEPDFPRPLHGYEFPRISHRADGGTGSHGDEENGGNHFSEHVNSLLAG